MVRLSRFAFDDPRGSDEPLSLPSLESDDPDCDEPMDGMTPSDEVSPHNDEQSDDDFDLLEAA